MNISSKVGNSAGGRIHAWAALHVVKFVCVAVMIFVHAHMMLISEAHAITDTAGFFYRVTSNTMYIGLFIFMLPILAGAIFRMNLDVYMIKDRLHNYPFKNVFRVAVFLALVGFLMNIFAFGIWYVFAWNILQLMALSLIVLVALLTIFSIRSVFLLGLGTLFFAGPLRTILANPDQSYVTGIFVGDSAGSMLWPFFPWFSVIAFGFLFAHYYLQYKDSIRFRLSALGIGILFLTIAILRHEISPYLDPTFIWGPSLFQPKFGFVLAAMGFFSVLVVIANFLFQDTKFKPYGIINSYSKGILWIYVFQMIGNTTLSEYIKDIFPMNKLSLAYFILPVGMLLLSWGVGALSIKLLQEKLLVITIKKVDA